MNDEAVCRTAPATPGLLIIISKLFKGVYQRQAFYYLAFVIDQVFN